MPNPIPYPFPYFSEFAFAPTVPNIYWNVYSQEQIIFQLSNEYQKLIAYNNALVDTINAQYLIIENLESTIDEVAKQETAEFLEEALSSGELDQTILDALAQIKSGTTYGDLDSNGFAYLEGE